MGDHVTATLDNAVSGTNGAVIPAGATVNLTVTQLKRSENANDPVVMAVQKVLPAVVNNPSVQSGAVEATTEFKASANVVKFTDEMWRSLLDIQSR